MKTIAQKIDNTLGALANIQKREALNPSPRPHYAPDPNWWVLHQESLDAIEDLLPSGSGIDSGVRIISVVSLLHFPWPKSEAGRSFLLKVPFHHMNENGFYTHWFDYMLEVTSTFNGVSVDLAQLPEGGQMNCIQFKKQEDYEGFCEATADYLCELLGEVLEQPYAEKHAN